VSTNLCKFWFQRDLGFVEQIYLIVFALLGRRAKLAMPIQPELFRVIFYQGFLFGDSFLQYGDSFVCFSNSFHTIILAQNIVVSMELYLDHTVLHLLMFQFLVHSWTPQNLVNPSPSHSSILIRFRSRLQNTKRVEENGSKPKLPSSIAAKPLIDLRISV
jgi:hypothetical protein